MKFSIEYRGSDMSGEDIFDELLAVYFTCFTPFCLQGGVEDEVTLSAYITIALLESSLKHTVGVISLLQLSKRV